MKTRNLVWILPLLLTAYVLPAEAATQVAWHMLTEPFDSICGGTGHLLADGVPVNIYHDVDSDGPDNTDPLFPLCANPPLCDTGPVGTANYNSFEINGGTVELEFPGGFSSEFAPRWAYFTYSGTPNPHRIYLRVCMDGRRYVSGIFTPSLDVINEYEMVLADWTCQDSSCPGCPPPPTPTNFRASDSTSCSSITLRWSYPDSASIPGQPVDSMFIYKEGNLIGRVRSRDTVYVDNITQVGNPPFIYNYYVQARRNCGVGNTNTANSSTDLGSVYPLPPTPTMQRASDDTCGYVMVRWTFGTTAGVDSFIIKRNGTRVGAVVGTPLGNRTFQHNTTDTTTAAYTVVAWNRVCLEGTPSAADNGKAIAAPTTPVTGIVATDTLCQMITVSWNTVPNTTTYQVYRYSDSGGNETALTPTVSHPTNTASFATGGTGFAHNTQFQFKVRAINSCGFVHSTEFDNGRSITVPNAVSLTLVSKGTSCDTTRITWTNVTNTQESGFKIYRRKISTSVIDSFTVPADTLRYFDLTAVPGDTYYYRVRAYNACGLGAISTTADSLGYRLATPLQVQNVQASDSAYCWGVQVSWNNLAYEDSFIVKRDGNRIGYRLANQTSFNDSTAVVGTRYGYTVFAKNKCGSGTESLPDSGSRKSKPPQVTGVQASDTACANVYITWNNVIREDSFKVLRNGVRIGAVPRDTLYYIDQTAVAGTRYAYSVSAWNCAAGDTSAIDSGKRITAPPVVVVTASDTLCSQPVITWTNVAGEDSFQIRRNGSRIGMVLANVLTYTDNTAVAGTRYKYEVAAYNACGFTTPLPSDSGTGHATPPQVVNVLATDSVHCWGVRITWTDTTDTDSFIIKRDGNRIGARGAHVLSFDDSTAVAGTVYNYTVAAKNPCNEGTASAANSGSRKSRPGLATGLTASTTRCDSIILVWNPLINTDRFRIIRNGIVTDSVLGIITSYNDRPAAGTYSYRVVGVNTCGVGDTSVVETGTRLATPPAVGAIDATDDNCDSVIVTWTDVAGEDGYRILRNGDSLTVTAADDTSYNDTTVIAGMRYKYEAAPYNACGFLAPVAADSGGRRTAPVQVPTLYATEDNCDSVFIGWMSISNVDSYLVYRNGAQINAQIGSVQYYIDRTATPGVRYEYYVIAKNACGSSAASPADSGMIVMFPAIPTGLSATQTLCDRIRLVWNAPADPLEDVDSIRIIRDGTDSVMIAGDSTGYDDLTAAYGVHTYRIRAVSNECGATALGGDGVSGTLLEPASVPDSVWATRLRCDSVVVEWTAATGDVDGYWIYENSAPIATVGPDTLRYAYQPAVGAYTYTIRSFSNECGFSVFTTGVSGTRMPLPSQVTNVTATADRCDGVMLQWTPGAPSSVDGYIVRANTATLDTVHKDSTRYFDAAAALGSTNYDVISYSIHCDDSDPTLPVAGIRQAWPVSPDTVEATTDRCDSVIVTWNAGSGAIDSYKVYRNSVLYATLPGDARRFGEVTTSGVVYVYSVTAWDSVCGEAAVIDTAHGMRQADASVPQNFVAANACDGINLSWNASTGAVAEYRVYRDDTLFVTVYPPDTTYLDTAVERSVTHVYKVTAFSAGCGETNFSNSDDGMRLPLPVQVTGLTASDDECAGILLNWNNLVGTEWYRIYRDEVLHDSVAGDVRTTTYLDTGVAPRASHSYRVGSVNICGEGALSDSARGVRYDVPDLVTGFFASDTSCTVINLIWNDATTETGYVIFRGTTAICTLAANVISYQDANAAPGTNEYTIHAMNECGLSIVSETASGVRIPGVAQVSDAAASSGICDRIDIQWTDLPNETGYIVWRNAARICTLGANVTTYSDVPAPGTYAYQVMAFNVCGEGALSAIDSGYRAWVPPQVIMLSATQDSCSSVTIAWTDVATEQYYIVLRNDAIVDTVDSNVTSYVDQPLGPGSYIYQVQAVNYCGNGLASTGLTGRVPDVPGVVTGLTASDTSCHAIYIRWNDLTDETKYHIFYDGSLFDSTAQNVTTYWTIPPVGTHQFAVRAENYCGVGDTSAWVTGERQGVPTAAPILTAPTVVCGSAWVTWTPISDVTYYVIYLDGDSLDSTTTTSQSVAADSGTHNVQIRGVNECGVGPLSAISAIYYIPGVAQVTGVAADTMNCVSVTVTWTDVAEETGYHIMRDSIVIDTLFPNTTQFVDTPTVGVHYYKVRGFNACYAGAYSDSVRGRRRGAPAVTTVTASDTSCANIIVSWASVTDVIGYYIFQNGTRIDSVGAETITITVTPNPGAYAYTVQPFNDCGLANISVADSGHRLTIPPRVIGVAATTNRCDSIIVTWPNVSGETRFVVFRGADSIGFAGANVLRYADRPDVGTYAYHVRADNQCGLGINSDTANGTRMVFPLAPINVIASDSLCGQIRVMWSSGGGDVDSFKIYRNDTLIATVASGVLMHIEGAIGTHVYHVVAHSNECGDSPVSLTDSGTGHNTADVPMGLFVAPEMCDTIRLTWTASTGEVEGYRIRRDGEVIDTVNTLQYADTTVDDPRDHVYAVAAYNTVCGSSAFTENVIGSMLPLAELVEQPAETVECRDTVDVALTFCLPVDSVTAFLSLDGGPYSVRIGEGVPTQSPETTTVIIPPIPDQVITPNCRVRIFSYRNGRVDTLDSNPFIIHCDLAADENLSEIPKEFFLDQNYPNPFNPMTNIRFGVPHESNITIEVFDVLGRKAATLVNGVMQPGVHTVTWNCSACPSGMYLIRMNTDDKVMMRKMLLMK